MSDEDKRPYPAGIAWDEAWRQRQRADKAEAERDNLADFVRRMAESPAEMGPTFFAGYISGLIRESQSLWAKMQSEVRDGS